MLSQARFLFRGSDQRTLVGSLSGGERNRLQLAKLLKRGGNVLVLDEPTNDLDLQTLRVLEEALQSFPGCAIVVTHDRYFLDRVATHILAFEGDGKVFRSDGPHEHYRERKAKRALAVRNLVENATRAAPEGTPISIGVEASSHETAFWVEDTGPGVPPEAKSGLFSEPFTPGKTGGTGLGLYIVRTIVEAHGGRVAYTEAPSGGARFSFWLPPASDELPGAMAVREGVGPLGVEENSWGETGIGTWKPRSSVPRVREAPPI